MRENAVVENRDVPRSPYRSDCKSGQSGMQASADAAQQVAAPAEFLRNRSREEIHQRGNASKLGEFRCAALRQIAEMRREGQECRQQRQEQGCNPEQERKPQREDASRESFESRKAVRSEGGRETGKARRGSEPI